MGLVGANGQPVMSAAAIADAVKKTEIGGREIPYYCDDKTGREQYLVEGQAIIKNTPAGPQVDLQFLINRALTNGMNVEALVRQHVEDSEMIEGLERRIEQLEAALATKTES